ncbi:2678_t:CDS:1, partial [Racocetra persica]
LHTSVILTDQENLEDEFGELYNSDREGELDVNDRKESKDDGWNKYDELNISDLEWGDEEDSGWDDAENIETEFKELNLI